LAEKALALGIKAAVFDRRGNRYQGRVAAVAAGARAAGLEF
jgi:large subunit ribosomal protein L18